MTSALVISPNAEIHHDIQSILKDTHVVESAISSEEAISVLKQKRFDILFADLNLFKSSVSISDFKHVLDPFWRIYPSIEIIIVVSKDKIHEAVKAVKAGAYDYLTFPIVPDELHLTVNSAAEYIRKDSELEFLRNQFWKSETLGFVQTKNHQMLEILDKIRIVSPTKTTVLLSGETGTGKSFFANLIHFHSNREGDPFISVHCGAIPDTLVESELFGHEKGAFTNAHKRKLGKFEIANNGTIFLDEIGTITPGLQIKLLQVLHNGMFSRVGGEFELKTDVRVIAATNSNLSEMVENGKFRKDLYYRINVFPIEIPPLRNRPEDIPLLVDTILNRLNQAFNKNISGVHAQVMKALKLYHWPGNIRELENVLERACLLESSEILTPESFPSEFFANESLNSDSPSIPTDCSLIEGRKKVIEDFERQYIKKIIARNKGKINASAIDAGIGTRQLHKLMSKYGIKKNIKKS